MNLSILYRGPLSSCNYGCAYCLFAKHVETAMAAKRADHIWSLSEWLCYPAVQRK